MEYVKIYHFFTNIVLKVVKKLNGVIVSMVEENLVIKLIKQKVMTG